ncbi:hypothetical protein PGH44_00005 [Legionella pneumophila]|nr:hypothetical protein PGH44_00005 [Legionella pneumophila]
MGNLDVSAHIINQRGDDYSAELTKKRLADALDRALGVIISSGAKPVLIESTAERMEIFHINAFLSILN